jgi:diguanylate cyclase (GGDEF)-like protein
LNIKELRPQFTVFVFLPELELSAELKQTFASSGYETFMFIDQAILVDRVRQAAPHVLLFSVEALDSSLSDFVQLILNANPEVRLICLSSAAATVSLSEYREFGLSQILIPGEFIAERALWATDVACEALALTYQNETLLEQSQNSELASQELRRSIENLQHDLAAASHTPEVKTLFERFHRAISKEEMITSYLNWFTDRQESSELRCIFFKFLPTVTSFVATQGINMDLERARGVGAKLQGHEIKGLMQLMFERRLPSSLVQLMKEGFGVEKYFTLPLLLQNQVEGVFVFWGIDESKLSSVTWPEFLIFQMIYQNSHYIKRNEVLETEDPVTQLFNRTYFHRMLEEEISRSRRLTKAVSVVKIAIDRFSEIEKEAGQASRDLILRSVATLVKKTSRIYDHTCRTGDEEISMILPHCTRIGAALRAERLRKAIESHSFAINGVHVTVTLGISEYPTLARYADELDQSSSQALEFMKSRGGNKVCMYKPREDFKPDFEVAAP